MVERLDRWWRVAATGFCFAVFGGGGVLLTLGAPLLWLVPGPQRRRRVARAAVRLGFRFFIGLMRFVRVLDYELSGVEKLQRPGLLVLANHPSLIDVIFLLSLVPQAGCVVKAALARNPFTRVPVRAAGYVTNDAGVALVDDCREALERGETLIIFPEGTRTPLSGEIELQRGAANVAIRCRVPVTPVSITSEPRVLARSQRWYEVPRARPRFGIRVHDDLPVSPFLGPGVAEPVAVRRLNEHVKAFFEQESRRAAP